MNCSCALNSSCGDEGYEELYCRKSLAKREYRCEECDCEILPGTYFRLEGFRDDDNEKTIIVRTCLDCASVIDHIFCEYVIGDIWVDLEEKLEDDPDFYVPENCLAKLTPTARADVCDLIEKYSWEN